MKIDEVEALSWISTVIFLFELSFYEELLAYILKVLFLRNVPFFKAVI